MAQGPPGALPPSPAPFKRPTPAAWPASLWAHCLSWRSPGAALYGRLRDYLLSEDQLKENGYPFPHPGRPGGAVIFTAEDKPPKDCKWPSVTHARQRAGGEGRLGEATAQAGCADRGPDASAPRPTAPAPQPPAGSAAAAARSTSCPPRAAVCATRSVTTTGDGPAGTEVRPPAPLSPNPRPTLPNFLSLYCIL